MRWELGSLPLLEETAFPSSLFSCFSTETWNSCIKPRACEEPRNRRSGFEDLVWVASLRSSALETIRPLEGYKKEWWAQRAARTRRKRWERTPSLPLFAVAWPGRPNTNIPGSLSKPSCLAAAMGPRPVPHRAHPPHQQLGADFLPSCPSASSVSLLLHTHREVRFSSPYLFALSKVSTFFQSSLFSVVYVSTLWE